MLPDGRALGLSAVLIANAFPGSCGGKGVNLDFQPTDCSCLPATVSVTVEGTQPGSIALRCDRTTGTFLEPTTGRRRVTVVQGNLVWHDETHDFKDGVDVVIPLRCPGR
jgi:hypothetical protein